MSYNRNNRRDYNNNNSNNEINEVINKIKKLDKLSDMTAKEYADEGGYADKVAENSKSLKTNQLRKFFGAVRLMEQKEDWDEIEPDFFLLKPKLAVAVGRGNIPKPFYKLMMETMKKVDVGSEVEKYENFETFVKFFESIVAYHKFHFQ